VGKRGPVKVQAVIEETLELLGASLTGGVRLDKRLQVGDAAVVGDATQLYQVADCRRSGACFARGHGGAAARRRPDGNDRRRRAKGTETLATAIAQSDALSIAGGGDTVAAIAKHGIEKDVGYLSTGGGAFLEVLEGKTLPALQILAQRAES
jgi:hypothetical protein